MSAAVVAMVVVVTSLDTGKAKVQSALSSKRIAGNNEDNNKDGTQQIWGISDKTLKMMECISPDRSCLRYNVLQEVQHSNPPFQFSLKSLQIASTTQYSCTAQGNSQNVHYIRLTTKTRQTQHILNVWPIIDCWWFVILMPYYSWILASNKEVPALKLNLTLSWCIVENFDKIKYCESRESQTSDRERFVAVARFHHVAIW